jgi:hypothetical protein
MADCRANGGSDWKGKILITEGTEEHGGTLKWRAFLADTASKVD